MIPKLKPYRSPTYLKFVRSQGCLICGRQAEAHHVRRQYWGAGIAQKPSDYVCIPLCADHHNTDVERSLNVERVIIDLLMRYIESKR